MQRSKRLTTLLLALLGAGTLWHAAPEAHADAESATEAATWPDHAACSLFGEHREEWLGVGRAAALQIAERRSELTVQVVAQLATRVTPLRSRAARPEQAIPPGPISGDSIDDFIFGALEREGIAPAPPTTDAELLRRATIDLLGRIPTQEEALAFLTDPSPDKRAVLVARLFEDSRWADRWAMFYGDLFRNTQRTAQVNRYPGGRDALHLFLLESLRANKPYYQMARELISGSGIADGRAWPDSFNRTSPFGTFEEYIGFLNSTPASATPASYIVGGRTTGGPIHDTYDALAATVARDFLGISHMDCILCHDGVGHLESLNAWGVEAKRSQGWGLSAFFEQVLLARPRYFLPARDGQGRGPRPPYWIVGVLEPGQVVRNQRGHLVAGAYPLDTEGGNRPARQPVGDMTAAEPEYFFTGGGPNPGESNQEALARLLTADKQFARAAVNYVWREFFGRGIVEPADQFDLLRLDPANPPPDPWTIQPSHPELLEWLADGFIASGFDLKWLMARIVSSEAYQLSSRYDGAWSPAYDAFFARHQVQRMDAEALYDSITVATGTPVNLPLPRQTRATLGQIQFAMQLPDVNGMPAAGRNLESGGALTLQFLDSFFRGDREESPRSNDVSILQALHSMNNEIVLARIRISATQSALAALLEQDDPTLVGMLYIRALGRFAEPDELAAGVEYLQGGDRRERAEDLLWALLNKVDFIFNY